MKTPTDEDIPVPKVKKPKQKVPGRGVRKRVLGQGEGDYCAYEIVPRGSDLPAGSLLPIPEVPRFASSVEAIRWIRNKSGDMLAGKQVMVLKAVEIMTIRVEVRPTVSIESKPKMIVTDPRTESDANAETEA